MAFAEASAGAPSLTFTALAAWALRKSLYSLLAGPAAPAAAAGGSNRSSRPDSAEYARLGGPGPLPYTQPTPDTDQLPQMSGHVTGLELPAFTANPAGAMSSPEVKGKLARKGPRGTTLAGEAVPEEDESSPLALREKTRPYARGLSSDPPVRSKIPRSGASAHKPNSTVAREPPGQRVAAVNGMASLPSLTPAAGMPSPASLRAGADVTQLNAERQALAKQYGFGEQRVPPPPMPGERPRPSIAANPTPMGMQQPAKKVPPGPALTRLGGAPDPDFELGSPTAGAPSPARPPAALPLHAGAVTGVRSKPAAETFVPQPKPGAHGAVGSVAGVNGGSRSAAPALTAAEVAQVGAHLKQGGQRRDLTWESLEEMSFEDLLSLEAGAGLAQLPPLPQIGSPKYARDGNDAAAAPPPKKPPPPPAQRRPGRAAPPAAAPAAAPAVGGGGGDMAAAAKVLAAAKGGPRNRPPPLQGIKRGPPPRVKPGGRSPPDLAVIPTPGSVETRTSRPTVISSRRAGAAPPRRGPPQRRGPPKPAFAEPPAEEEPPPAPPPARGARGAAARRRRRGGRRSQRADRGAGGGGCRRPAAANSNSCRRSTSRRWRSSSRAATLLRTASPARRRGWRRLSRAAPRRAARSRRAAARPTAALRRCKGWLRALRWRRNSGCLLPTGWAPARR